MFIKTGRGIKSIKFELLSPSKIKKMSVVKVVTPDTYDEDGYPIERGLMDVRLGVIDPGLRCRTCGGRMRECLGHFGHIELVEPVIHVEYAKHIYDVLRATCKSCSRVLLTKEEIEEIQSIKVSQREIMDIVLEKTKNRKKCPYCGAEDQYSDGCEKCGRVFETKEIIDNPVQFLCISKLRIYQKYKPMQYKLL